MMRAQGKRVINYIGFCADENRRFKFDLESREDNVTQIYPLAEAGIRENTIWLWAREHPIFNDYYKYNRRCGCMGCPMASKQEMAYLYTHYREEFDRIAALAQATEERVRQKFPGYQTWSCLAKDLEEWVQGALPLKQLPVDPFQYNLFENLS